MLFEGRICVSNDAKLKRLILDEACKSGLSMLEFVYAHISTSNKSELLL